MRGWVFGAVLGAGFMMLEPALERAANIKTLGDLLNGPRYLAICPTAELAYLFKPLRAVPIHIIGIIGLAAIIVSTAAAIINGRPKPIWKYTGYALITISAIAIAGEYVSGEYWHIGPIQVRYAAMPAFCIGAALLSSNRGYLCALAIFGLLWDISSAIFVGLKEGFTSRLPVPYWGRLDATVSGPKAFVPIIVDSAGLIFFIWLWRTKFDPLHIFNSQKFD